MPYKKTCNEGTCSTITLLPLVSREEIQDFLQFLHSYNLFLAPADLSLCPLLLFPKLYARDNNAGRAVL